MGRALLLCPERSDVDLLCDGEGVVHSNAEIPDGALYLGVTKQKLDGAQIPGAAVDHCQLSERRSTRRPKAQLPLRQIELAGPVHSQNGCCGRFDLSWVIRTRQSPSYRSVKTPPYHFIAMLGGTICAFEHCPSGQLMDKRFSRQVQ